MKIQALPRRRLLAMALIMTAVATGMLGSCAAPNPHYDASRAHHHPTGFRNLHTDVQPKGMMSLLQWQWDAIRNGLPRPASTPTPSVAPDVAFIQRNATAGADMQPAITWIGHSSMLLQTGGLNLLIDPVFSERASPLSFTGPKRVQPPGLSLAQLPRIDAVLISHNHYDHLDEASVIALAAQAGGSPRFLVPLGLKRWFEDLGIREVREMDWWDSHRLEHAGQALDILFTPAQHWSGRTLMDRMQSLWGGFAILSPSLRILYTGDTGYSPDFVEIRRRLAPRLPAGGFDLAMIPVGAYEPRWFMRPQHVNPQEAVRIHQDLGAARSVGVHWGTFNLTDESLDEPPIALARAREAAGLPPEAFFLMAIGETRRLPVAGR